MTKQIIKTDLEIDWINNLEDKSVYEAIKYLKSLPKDAVLAVDWDYDSKCGETFISRLETDEEYAARLAQEAEEQRQREEADRKAQEQLTERMMLIAAKDVAFKAYMEKHKDNPNIGDLSNLFMAAVALGKEGQGSSVVGPLLECMSRLEEEGGTWTN